MRLQMNVELVTTLFTGLIILQSFTKAANPSHGPVRYTKVGNCGPNSEGVRMQVSGQQEHYCYMIVNSAARIGTKKDGIPIDHMAVVSDYVQLTLSDGDSTGGNITLVGDTAPGTFVSVQYKYPTQDSPKTEISFFSDTTGLASIHFTLNGDITVSRDRKGDFGTKVLSHGFKDSSMKKHEIFVLFMNQYLKLYINNVYIGDYPYPGRVDAVRQMSIWGNIPPDNIMQGTIGNTVKNVHEADSYCRRRHSGHLLVYESKTEQDRLDAILGLSRSSHSLFEVFGLTVTDDGELESYDGTSTSYIKGLLQGSKDFFRKGKCLYRFRFRNADGKGVKDVVDSQDCNLPISTFICRSRISREVGGVAALASQDESAESPLILYLCIAGYVALIIVSLIGTISALTRPKKTSGDERSSNSIRSYPQDNIYDEPPPQQTYDNPPPPVSSNVPPPPDEDEPVVHYAATDPSSTALTVHDDAGSDDY